VKTTIHRLCTRKGLTEIVQARDDDGNEQNVMDILQTLTVMMEENDRSKGEKVPTPQAARGETPRDPVHVSSPTKVPDSEPVALQAVVEELFRMRKQRNHRDRESLYHKLCNSRTSKS